MGLSELGSPVLPHVNVNFSSSAPVAVAPVAPVPPVSCASAAPTRTAKTVRHVDRIERLLRLRDAPARLCPTYVGLRRVGDRGSHLETRTAAPRPSRGRYSTPARLRACALGTTAVGRSAPPFVRQGAVSW